MELEVYNINTSLKQQIEWMFRANNELSLIRPLHTSTTFSF